MPLFRGQTIVSSSSDYKDSVRVATRSNVNLAGSVVTVDGISLADKDRVLLLGQTNAAQNGIYTWSVTNSQLTRAKDADSVFELTPGNKVYVEEGNSFARTTWTLINQGAITIGSTNLVFAKENRLGTTDISGTYGSSTKTLQIVVDESGQITAVTEYTIDGLPSQTNNSGKYLTTNGTTASWATISTTLDGLSDVDTTGVADNYGLVYDNSTSSWKAEQVIPDDTIIDGGNLDGASSGSGVTTISDVHSIDDLSDVVITNPTNDQVLKYNGTNWINSTDGGGATPASYLTWEIVSTNTTCVAGKGYFVDTSSTGVTMTLPASATLGDTIRFNDLAGTFSTNNLIVAANGHKIQGQTGNLTASSDQSSFGLVYSNATYGWKIMEL